MDEGEEVDKQNTESVIGSREFGRKCLGLIIVRLCTDEGGARGRAGAGGKDRWGM